MYSGSTSSPMWSRRSKRHGRSWHPRPRSNKSGVEESSTLFRSAAFPKFSHVVPATVLLGRAGLTHALDDLADSGHDEIGLVELDPMGALRRDQVSALR